MTDTHTHTHTQTDRVSDMVGSRDAHASNKSFEKVRTKREKQIFIFGGVNRHQKFIFS